MQVHVKTPRIDIKGEDFPELIEFLIKAVGEEQIEFIEEGQIDITETDWYNTMEVTPGETVEIHRLNINFTQAVLGDKLGGKSKQFISDIEKGRRNISIKLAKLLGEALGHNYKAYL